MGVRPEHDTSIRVLVVDREALVRESVALALAKAGGFLTKACPPEPRELVQAVRSFCPKVALVSVAPDSDRVLRVLASHAQQVRVLGLASAPDALSARRLVELGMAGLIPHSANIQDIVFALLAVASGYAVVAPDALSRLVEQQGTRGRGRSVHASSRLTHRELRTLAAMSQGLTDAQIARIRGVSVPSVKAEVRSILRKIGARNRTEAVARALQYGLVCGTARRSVGEGSNVQLTSYDAVLTEDPAGHEQAQGDPDSIDDHVF
jgi:DNA-binding NarL/FixJ family response regulator